MVDIDRCEEFIILSDIQTMINRKQSAVLNRSHDYMMPMSELIVRWRNKLNIWIYITLIVNIYEELLTISKAEIGVLIRCEFMLKQNYDKQDTIQV